MNSMVLTSVIKTSQFGNTYFFLYKNLNIKIIFIIFMDTQWAYSQLGYPKGQSNEKRTTKDYFGFLLYLIFHDYSGLVYDYN